MRTDEASAAQNGNVAGDVGRGGPHRRRGNGRLLESVGTDVLASLHQHGAEPAIERRLHPGIQCRVKCRDARFHTLKEWIVPSGDTQRRSGVLRSVAAAFSEYPGGGARTGCQAIHRVEPSRPPVREHPVRQNVGQSNTVVAYHCDLPEWKFLAHRETQLCRQFCAG